MKKMVVIVLAVVFAAPALAVVNIDAVHEGDYVVRLDYSVVSEPNLVRAFALDIDVNNSQTITAVVPILVGECNSVVKNYGIFPGSIKINASGDVTDYNDPVAPIGDLGAAGELGDPALTIEMGSLYVDSNAPLTSGTLCKITVSGDCTLCITPNAERSGVVLENGASSEDAGSPVDVNSPCVDIAAAVGCDCWGSVPGLNAGQSYHDALVGLPDVTAIIGYIKDYGSNAYDAPIVSPFECVNISGGSGVPDQYIGLGDVTAIIGYIKDYGSNAYDAPCMDDPN